MDFLINRTQKPSWNPHLLGLPNDTIVDRIFVYLDVADILCVRRVRISLFDLSTGLTYSAKTCKLLYHLTHHAVLWKRLLRSTELPIPPVPPTSRHSLKNLSAFEAERLMVRAASLAWCWQWTTPQVFDAWKFEAYHCVKQMVLLPGSQYMVASVCETNGTNWSLVVYVMDGRYNVVPIAKMPTDTKAYNVVAKYLTIDGVDGITIAYIRRAWRHRADAKKGFVSGLFIVSERYTYSNFDSESMFPNTAGITRLTRHILSNTNVMPCTFLSTNWRHFATLGLFPVRQSS